MAFGRVQCLGIGGELLKEGCRSATHEVVGIHVAQLVGADGGGVGMSGVGVSFRSVNIGDSSICIGSQSGKVAAYHVAVFDGGSNGNGSRAELSEQGARMCSACTSCCLNGGLGVAVVDVS